jgi:hypothetical protein
MSVVFRTMRYRSPTRVPASARLRNAWVFPEAVGADAKVKG